MCFFTERSKIRLAIKNIECYKEVRTIKNYYFKNCCFSYYQDFKYEYDKIYSSKSKWTLFLNWIFDISVSDEAYHSYAYNPCPPYSPIRVVRRKPCHKRYGFARGHVRPNQKGQVFCS